MEGIDTIEQITPKVIDDTFAVNVRGTILMTKEMINNRSGYGRVINLSTDAAQVFAGQISYGASKATIEALTRSIAIEAAPYGITVNNLSPGVIATPRNDAALSDKAYAEKVMAGIPMHFAGEPRDMAGAALLLASDAGRYITGIDLAVDGGMGL